MSDGSDVAWSCVVDDKPQIWSSLVPWLATALKLACIDPSRIHVHHVCPLRPDVADLCRALAVHTHPVEPFDPRHPHTNKIRQCSTAFHDARRVVLTDVDIAFASRPPLEEIHAPVAGKPVDKPNPPIEVLRAVFLAAGLPAPGVCTNTYLDSANAQVRFETFPGNYNGGLYVIHRDHLDRIGRAWARWARWLIAHVELLDRWSVHVDQVSFCLAVNELRTELDLLGNVWNQPLNVAVPSAGEEPYILHHHGALDDRLRLIRNPAPGIQEAIARVNGAVEKLGSA